MLFATTDRRVVTSIDGWAPHLRGLIEADIKRCSVDCVVPAAPVLHVAADRQERVEPHRPNVAVIERLRVADSGIQTPLLRCLCAEGESGESGLIGAIVYWATP